MENLKQLSQLVDSQWVEENVDTCVELIQALIKEYYHDKEMIYSLRGSLMLANAIIESMNGFNEEDE